MDEKPVYRTGDSVGSIMQQNVAAESAAVANPTPNVETPVATPAEAPVVSTTETPTPNTATPPVEPEINISTFKFDNPEAEPKSNGATPPSAPTPNTQPLSWREALKTADPKEVYKELGLTDFALELNSYLAKGGKASDYLEAKSVDWNTKSDEEVVKDAMKRELPNLTGNEINRLFNKKYGVSADAEQEEREDAALMLKVDAHSKRQSFIDQQSKFKIPDAIVPDNTEQFRQQQEAAVQKEELLRQWYNEHEATKSLMTSKRVALDLGDNGTFNFSVDQPDMIVKAITDGDFWQRITSTKQGEPDIAKMQKIALYALNPQQFEADLVGYGKSLKLRELTKEGQNLTPPGKVLPMQQQQQSEKEAWKNAKSSTVGGRS